MADRSISSLPALPASDDEPVLQRVPGWEVYPWLRAGFSTRQGGRSEAYGPRELNLGRTVEDDPAAVAANRTAFVRALGDGRELALHTVQQVHGAVVHEVDALPGPLMTSDGRPLLEGDGLLTRTPGRLLAVLTADCVPVLLADTRSHAVGALHAGWRGTLARIVERGVAQMTALYGSRPKDLIAAIGPCIGGCCFEVGPEVRTAFEAAFPYGSTLFDSTAKGRLQMDLVEANRQQLLAAGLSHEAITAMGECTACTRLADGRRRYFSYRAEVGRTGRMLSGITAIA